MSEIVLSGIRGDLPIGAMAAFGVLRVCTEEHGIGDARLHWTRTGAGWRPVLSSDQEIGREDLVSHFAQAAGVGSERYELTWAEQVKSATLEQFRAAAKNEHTSNPQWFAAFGTDVILEKGMISPTPLDMTVARQKFLADAVKLARRLGGDKAAFTEALYGPWRYDDDQHSLGWDPTTMRLGAFTNEAPTTMRNRGVRAAVWLGFESIPLFPCFCSGGKLTARGFTRSRRSFVFRWPIWKDPISLTTLKSLLGNRDLYGDKVSRALTARGISAVYSSECFKPNKYMIGFRSSLLLAGGG